MLACLYNRLSWYCILFCHLLCLLVAIKTCAYICIHTHANVSIIDISSCRSDFEDSKLVTAHRPSYAQIASLTCVCFSVTEIPRGCQVDGLCCALEVRHHAVMTHLPTQIIPVLCGGLLSRGINIPGPCMMVSGNVFFCVCGHCCTSSQRDGLGGITNKTKVLGLPDLV